MNTVGCIRFGRTIIFKNVLLICIFLILINSVSASDITQQQNFSRSEQAFGVPVAIYGNTAVIAAHLVDGYTGSVFVYTRSGTAWTLQQELNASDQQVGDRFGDAIDIDGNTMVVAAWFEGEVASNAGAVYVFTRSGSTWTQQQKITAFDGTLEDYFGESVSISGDRIIVGASYDDPNGTNSGSAYVYKLNGSNWTLEQKIVPGDVTTGNRFGRSVDINGTTAIITTEYGDAAYIFIYNGTNWTQQQKLLGSSDFGSGGVALDGDSAIVGSGRILGGTGRAHVYTRSGSAWTLQQELSADDAAASDFFGFDVDIKGDVALIGAYGNNDNGSDSGSAYVFNRSGSTWIQHQKLLANDAATNDEFGTSVAMAGNYFIIGTGNAGGSGAWPNKAYIFSRNVTTEVDTIDKSLSVSGANVTKGISGRLTKPSASSDAAGAGNTTELNLSSAASTVKWQGYFGEIAAALHLGISFNPLYSFGTAINNQIKTVLASPGSSFDFSSLRAASVSDVDSAWSFSIEDADSVTTTLNDTSIIAQVSSVPTVNLNAYSNTGIANNSIYKSGVLADKDSPTAVFDFAFGVSVDSDERDFRNVSVVDYELIVPVNTSGVAGTQTYYFFLDVE